jgi:hypothetical protein
MVAVVIIPTYAKRISAFNPSDIVQRCGGLKLVCSCDGDAVYSTVQQGMVTLSAYTRKVKFVPYSTVFLFLSTRQIIISTISSSTTCESREGLNLGACSVIPAFFFSPAWETDVICQRFDSSKKQG